MLIVVVDDELIAVIKNMLNYNVLDEPKTIRVAGQQILVGTAMGIGPGVITDKAWTKHKVGLPIVAR